MKLSQSSVVTTDTNSNFNTVGREVAAQRSDIAGFELPGVAQWLLDRGLPAKGGRVTQIEHHQQLVGDAKVGDAKVGDDKGLDKARGGFARKIIHKKLSDMTRGSLLLDEAGSVTYFGAKEEHAVDLDLRATIKVNNPAAYKRMLLNGVLGAAEAYMEGDWSTPDLLSVIRFFVANMEDLQRINQQRSWLNRAALASLSWVSRNTIQRSQKNISAHYDLGNDFFKLFLDPSMLYSSAIFERDDMTLEQASIAKMERLCQQLQLRPEDHLLEIGTGWGAMAVYAAENYGCRVSTTTISQEQFDYATRLVASKGLQNRVTVYKRDYRELNGQYDKLVSIEMIEAVGHEFYQQYFSKCSSLLKSNGLMAVQAITVPDQRYVQAKKNVDFIKRYIFPGGCLPSIEVISKHIANDTDMVISDIFDITQDYAKTLACWREAFFKHIDQVSDMGFDNRFIRMWEYYLCYCEGGFTERVIGTHQILFSKPDYRFR